MAYSDYGAYVYMNGERREDKEDVALFETPEETFDVPAEEVPSAARIFMSLIHAGKIGKVKTWITSIHHGIMGDGSIRVLCHKQHLPQVYELTENGIKEINVPNDVEPFDWGTVEFEYKGYKFKFESGEPNIATMIEPDGTEWRCEYDYWYGAGF